MLCPFCVRIGTAAAHYGFGQLARHVARRHPLQGAAVGIVGTVLVTVFGPRIVRAVAWSLS